MNGLFALSMPLMVLREKTMASLVGGILFASAFAAVSVGLLYRRRFGVVGYLGLSVIIELGVLISSSRRFDSSALWVNAFALTFIVLNFIYFGTRWKLMATTTTGRHNTQPAETAE